MTVLSLPTETLVQSPLSPEHWPFHIEWLPRDCYLVGGVVRDAILGRQADYLDLDFVLPSGSIEVAKTIARHYRAGFVVLDAERQIARVVFEQATVDFALQEGDSLERDLRRRDFTINAMAYDPQTQTLIDPLGGYEDLQAGRLRMVSKANLADDPLRLLRGYRQAAQLGLILDPDTEAAIQDLSSLMGQVAAERVQSELNSLLKSDRGTPWLCRALRANLLQPWLPNASANHPDQAQRLAQLQRLDDLALHLQSLWPALNWQTSSPPELSKAIGRSSLALTKLTALVAEDPLLAETQLQTLKYSRAEVRAAGLIRRHQAQIDQPLTIRDQYFLFQSLGGIFPLAVLMALSLRSDWFHLAALDKAPISQLMARFLNPADPVAYPHPFLTGKDLIETLGIRPGPRIGQILLALQIAQAEGRITTRDEALTLAQQPPSSP